MSIKHIVTFCGLSFVSLVLCGCPGKSVDTSGFESTTNSADSTDLRKTERMFDSSIETLNRLEKESNVNTDNRVRGRLNEWIKTASNPADWKPDPMTPQWQRKIQNDLSFISQCAHQIQLARQDVNLNFNRIIQLFNLQNEFNKLVQYQTTGANDQETLNKIAKNLEEWKKISDELENNKELEKFKTPQSLKTLLEQTPKIRQFLTDESAPAYDSWNAEAFDKFVTKLNSKKKLLEDLLVIRHLSDKISSEDGKRIFFLQVLHFLTEESSANIDKQVVLNNIRQILADKSSLNVNKQDIFLIALQFLSNSSVSEDDKQDFLNSTRQILADKSNPAYNSKDVELFDDFVTELKTVDKVGLINLLHVFPNGSVGINQEYYMDFMDALDSMDNVSSWFNGIAGDFALEEMSFMESDINYLQESIWLRDASDWAQGTSADDLSRIMALFDWTMKNIALESSAENHTNRVSENEPEDNQSCRPIWQILLSGRGTAAERAWVFARLAEHQGLNVVLVRVPIPEQSIPPAPEPAQTEENAPTPEPAQTEENAPAPEPAPTEENAPAPEPAQTEENAPAPEPAQTEENAPAPEPAQTEENAPAPEPAQTEENAPAPEPAQTEENAPAPEPAPASESESTTAEEESASSEPEEITLPEIDSATIEQLSDRQDDNKASQEVQTMLPELPDIAPPERLLAAWIYEDKLYFFDPEYGLPIPAPNGISISTDAENKGLKIVPATLDQILNDESVLNRMSFTDSRNKERKYYLTSDDFKNAEYYLPVNPTSLSKRMWVLENRLTGKQKMRLTSSPSAVKSQLEKLVPGATVNLWDTPYAAAMFNPMRQSFFNSALDSVINMPIPDNNDAAPLRRARITHLKGELAMQNDEDNLEDYAVVWYQRSRLSEGKIIKIVNSRSNSIPPEHFMIAKYFATYWLGLLSDALDNHNAADEYFSLIIKDKTNFVWMAPALYNIGRVEEKTGQFDKAIDNYQMADGESRLYIGAALRAQWLKELGMRSEE